MTVAAVILSATTEGAMADLDGQARVRRLADVAWSGGALPVIVVAPDPDGAVAATLAGSPAELVAPAPREAGPVGQIACGVDAACETVAETTGALLWPARLVWVDPETLTSLIEAHGADRQSIIRPSYDGEPGWPVLLPVAHLAAFRALASDRMPDELIDDAAATGLAVRLLELGDPGTTHDVDVARDALPAFRGPEEPVAGPPPEWGAGVTG